MDGGAACAGGHARTALILVASVLCSNTPAAAARTGGRATAGAGHKASLRADETRMLGGAHAAEHARARASQRAMLRAGADPAPPRAQASDGPAAEVGRWNRQRASIAMPVVAINAVVLPTGRVMLWGRPPSDPAAVDAGTAWLWDPATGLTKRIDPPAVVHPDGRVGHAEIWCSGQSVLADGRVLVTGGNLADATPTSDWKGLSTVFAFDPFSETWTVQPSMRHGRWYPSQLLMGDGRTLIMGGLDESGTSLKNRDLELFTPAATAAAQGSLSLIGGRGAAGQPPDGGLYPHLFWMRGGHALVAGPQSNDSWSLTPASGTGTFAWENSPNLSRSRLFGNAVLLPGGPDGSTRLLEIGGIDESEAPATADTEIFDEATSSWRAGSSQSIGRAHANTVLLPDGSMVTVGGGVGHGPTAGLYEATPEQKQVEVYDPRTAKWRLGPAQQLRRTYHSTALLLPDGRVLSAGDDGVEAGVPNSGRSRDDAEIYEPPYLFDADGSLAARPQISLAPAHVPWATRFAIRTTSDVARAVLVAPAAVTHANDMNQRHVELSIAARYPGSGVDVLSPPSVDVAPPGYYMLFLVDGRGVPSVARFIRLDPAPIPDVPSASDTIAPSAAQPPPPVLAPAPPPPAPAAVAGLRLSPGTFRAATSGATVKKTAGRAATRISYTLNVAARVRFTVERAGPGRRVSGRCVRATTTNRRRKSCTLFVRVRGSFTRTRPAGPDRFAFTGRVARRALKPGRHRLVATPTGDRSARPTSAPFRIRTG